MTYGERYVTRSCKYFFLFYLNSQLIIIIEGNFSELFSMLKIRFNVAESFKYFYVRLGRSISTHCHFRRPKNISKYIKIIIFYKSTSRLQ